MICKWWQLDVIMRRRNKLDTKKLLRVLFFIAAVYDGILGCIGLVFPLWLFNMFQVPPPNHLGYVQFPALLLIIFAILFLNIAFEPEKNKQLIIYGILLKVSYCAVIFSHWFLGNMPAMWIPFAFFDVVFLLTFVWAYVIL